MLQPLIWLKEVLLNAKLKVAEVPGWEERTAGEMGPVFGVVCHHTAGPKHGNMPSLKVLVDGRPDLRGPLAQLGLGRDGTFYLVAAGRANHAGPGEWQGVTQGNRNLIGIEAENTGLPGDPWPAVQLDAYQRGVAAILKHAGLGALRCAGHKEYALPHGRKSDPTLDMPAFRKLVAKFMSANAPVPSVIPSVEPAGSGAQRPTLRRTATGAQVEALQKKLALKSTGTFDANTEAAIRQFQRDHDLVPDGIAGPKTWAALDRSNA
jgi:N-acetyl-anhydromuramyl-L-alanine amidase AmpD